jgi:hypothetical protein
MADDSDNGTTPDGAGSDGARGHSRLAVEPIEIQ